MSPTVFTKSGLRFHFFSREESRMHIHVTSQRGEAKFWIEPVIELAQNHGMSEVELKTASRLIKEHEDDIRKTWHLHFDR
ncbi:DUF4160 domain-containing protein [Geobacter sp. SVR]|uniref:DUF4160 domain-containing protein n=1 Tax=Geobacter sp. SVR TaxID=2495594 RepID=UPI001564EF47